MKKLNQYLRGKPGCQEGPVERGQGCLWVANLPGVRRGRVTVVGSLERGATKRGGKVSSVSEKCRLSLSLEFFKDK